VISVFSNRLAGVLYFLLKMLQEHIRENGQSGWRTVWFTAWKYDQREALWRALILRVIDALYPQSDDGRLAYDELTAEQQALVDELDRLQESVYRPLDWQELGKWTVDWFQLLKEGGKAGAEIAAAFIPSIVPRPSSRPGWRALCRRGGLMRQVPDLAGERERHWLKCSPAGLRLDGLVCACVRASKTPPFRWVRFNFGAICLMVHWPSELRLCRRFAPTVALRRPGRRRASAGRRPEVPDLSRPGTQKSAPILKRPRSVGLLCIIMSGMIIL
jgi:hypothetical protein